MATKLSIINNALLMVGAETITTLTDSSREARVAAAQYDVTRDDIISRHPWNFTKGQVQLAQVAQKPLFGYNYAYQLPVDPKLIRIIRKNSPRNDYSILEDKLYTDDKTVEILYQFDPGEKNYPSYFVVLLEYEMAKKFAFSLMQDETQGQIFASESEKQQRIARNIDSQNNAPRKINPAEYLLTAARWNG